MQSQSTARSFASWLIAILVLVVLASVGGYLFWQSMGQIQFQGTFCSGERMLLAGRDGMVLRQEVREGTPVQKGTLLLSFEDSALRKELAQEKELLAKQAALLPPEVLTRTPAGEIRPLEEGGMNLNDSLEAQRLEEASATSALQDATDKEAAASVYYSRMANLYAQGKASVADKNAAEGALEVARRNTLAAKKNFESLSLVRAGTGTEIRKIRDYHKSIGADALPADVRLRNHALQAAKVAELEKALAESALYAPEDGTVVTFFLNDGSPVAVGQPCVGFLPHSSLATVEADIERDAAAKMKQGHQCIVAFAGSDGAKVPGYIRALFPSPAYMGGTPGAIRVLVGLHNPVTGNHLPYPDGSRAEITVLLREPLLSIASPYTGQSGAAQAPAAPPSLPIHRQDEHEIPVTPMAPVKVEAGSPEARGLPFDNHTEPASPLPPMKAPYPLQGSPYPDPSNNPSIVPPKTLEPAPDHP